MKQKKEAPAAATPEPRGGTSLDAGTLQESGAPMQLAARSAGSGLTGSLAMMLPDEKEWAWLENCMERLIKTGLLPKWIDTPAKGVLAFLKGREVGLPPMLSLEGIYVVHGRTGLTAQAYGYLLTRAGVKIDWPRHDKTAATCRITRPDGRVFEQTFTMDDASRMFTTEEKDGKRATIRLSDSLQYRSNAEEMLMNRAQSRGARRACPDIVGGAYLADEINDMDQTVIDVPAAPVQAPGTPDLGETLKGRLDGTSKPPESAIAPPAAPAPIPSSAPSAAPGASLFD